MSTAMLAFTDRVATDPDGVAIASDGLGTVTWQEAGDVVLRLAEAIRTFDLGAERRVMVVARNRPSTVLAHAAALLGEASAVPVNFHLTAGEIEYQVGESGARLMFVDRGRRRARPARPQRPAAIRSPWSSCPTRAHSARSSTSSSATPRRSSSTRTSG